MFQKQVDATNTLGLYFFYSMFRIKQLSVYWENAAQIIMLRTGFLPAVATEEKTPHEK